MTVRQCHSLLTPFFPPEYPGVWQAGTILTSSVTCPTPSGRLCPLSQPSKSGRQWQAPHARPSTRQHPLGWSSLAATATAASPPLACRSLPGRDAVLRGMLAMSLPERAQMPVFLGVHQTRPTLPTLASLAMWHPRYSSHRSPVRSFCNRANSFSRPARPCCRTWAWPSVLPLRQATSPCSTVAATTWSCTDRKGDLSRSFCPEDRLHSDDCRRRLVVARSPDRATQRRLCRAARPVCPGGRTLRRPRLARCPAPRISSPAPAPLARPAAARVSSAGGRPCGLLPGRPAGACPAARAAGSGASGCDGGGPSGRSVQ